MPEVIYAVLAILAIGALVILIVKMSALSHALNDAAARQQSGQRTVGEFERDAVPLTLEELRRAGPLGGE